MTSVHEVIDAFTQDMREHGLETDAPIIADGQLHRVRDISDKAGKKDLWYILHAHDVPNGIFGHWAKLESTKWLFKSFNSLTPLERTALSERMANDRRIYEAEKAKLHAAGKIEAERQWAKGVTDGCGEHPYLVKKGVMPYGVKQLGKALLVPILTKDEVLVGLQSIYPDGAKIILKGSQKIGCYHLIEGDRSRVLICEGYATGASLHEATGFSVAIAFDAHNLMVVAKALREKLPDTELVLCAEDDRNNNKNTGMSKATDAALAIGGLLAVPSFADGAIGTDFNDMHQLSGIEAVTAAVEAAALPSASKCYAENLSKPDIEGTNSSTDKPQHSSILSRHKYAGGEFLVSANGVSFSFDNDTKWLCSKLMVSAKTRDANSGEWGRLLEWSDSDGVMHQWAMPMELLQGDGSDVRRELAKQGLSIAPGRHARELLASYLQVWPVEARARCVSKLGWHGGVYLTPNCAIGESNEKVVFQNAQSIEPGFAVSGTLDEWRQFVGVAAAGNSRLVFSLSVAFAGALAAVAGEDSGGFHLRGPSSIGKSTGLKLAASVWGHPEVYRRMWRATANGLEGLAAMHNDGVLILDELSQCDPREAGEAAYMLANGQGKARASRTGAARSSVTWRTLFLSAGEVSLTTLMASAGKKANTGQEIRLADIAADAGAGIGSFETTHGQSSPSAFAEAMILSATKYHGTAGMEWLNKIVAEREHMVDLIADGISRFVSEVVPAGASGQVMRVARRFALVSVAGELATYYGITGWREGEAIESAAKCFSSWIEGFGGIGNREQSQMLAQVRGFFEAHGASRFEDPNATHDQRVHNRVGFVRTTPTGEREYIVMREAFKTEICKGLDYKAVSAELVANGWLRTNGDHHTISTTIPGQTKDRFYVFTSRLWEMAA